MFIGVIDTPGWSSAGGDEMHRRKHEPVIRDGFCDALEAALPAIGGWPAGAGCV
jgi:hypothetical protein